MHTFLSRGSGQASARQYVQATSGKGLRPAAQPQRGDEAAVRIDGARRVLIEAHTHGHNDRRIEDEGENDKKERENKKNIKKSRERTKEALLMPVQNS